MLPRQLERVFASWYGAARNRAATLGMRRGLLAGLHHDRHRQSNLIAGHSSPGNEGESLMPAALRPRAPLAPGPDGSHVHAAAAQVDVVVDARPPGQNVRMRSAAGPRQEATCVHGPDHGLLATAIEIAEYPASRLGFGVQHSRGRLRERIDPRMEFRVVPADLAVSVG